MDVSSEISQVSRLEDLDDDVQLVKPEVSALEAISRSEIAMQLDAAHRWPRSVTRFLRDATTLSTYSREVAERCMYSVPRGGKMITGKSIRLAEICASCWGNLHTGARVIDVTETTVVSQAIAWDLERNSRFTIEASRGILDKHGERFSEDMVRVTGMAAISVAMRNAIFRAIPAAFVDPIYAKAKAVAVGDIKTLAAKRDEWLASLARLGVTPERLFAKLGIPGEADFTQDHLIILIGTKNAIENNEIDIDTAFPPVAAAPLVTIGVGPAKPGAPATPSSAPEATPQPVTVAEGKRVSVGTGKRGRAAAAPPAAAPAAASSAPARSETAPPAAAPAPQPADPIAAVKEAARSAPDAEPPVNPATLLKALATVDEAWKAADGAEIIASWSEPARRDAMRWALSVLEDAPMAEQARRPPFTYIDGPEGDEVEP